MKAQVKKKKKKQRAACSIHSEAWVMELKLKPEVSQNPPEQMLRFSQLNWLGKMCFLSSRPSNIYKILDSGTNISNHVSWKPEL